MKTFQQAKLADFRPNQKFTWNGRIYTVFQHCPFSKHTKGPWEIDTLAREALKKATE